MRARHCLVWGRRFAERISSRRYSAGRQAWAAGKGFEHDAICETEESEAAGAYSTKRGGGRHKGACKGVEKRIGMGTFAAALPHLLRGLLLVGQQHHLGQKSSMERRRLSRSPPMSACVETTVRRSKWDGLGTVGEVAGALGDRAELVGQGVPLPERSAPGDAYVDQ
eukprot:4160643-Prymnesium_polylepis.1